MAKDRFQRETKVRLVVPGIGPGRMSARVDWCRWFQREAKPWCFAKLLVFRVRPPSPFLPPLL